MNLDAYIKIAKSHAFFIVALALIGAICGYISTSHIASGYKAQQTIFVKINKNDPTNQDIDHQTTTDTVVAYISDTDYQRSINTNNTTASAKKIAAQVAIIQATSAQPSKSQSAIENTIVNFNSDSKNLIKNANVELVRVGITGAPTKNVLNSKALALAGALLGLTASILIISTSRYFRL